MRHKPRRKKPTTSAISPLQSPSSRLGKYLWVLGGVLGAALAAWFLWSPISEEPEHQVATDVATQWLEQSRAAITGGDVSRAMQLGKKLFSAGQISAAERCFRFVAERKPENLAAHEQLIYLFSLEGRTWELRDHVLALFRAGQFSHEHLLAVSSTEQLLETSEKFVAAGLRANPSDPLPQLHSARVAWNNGNESEAVRLLKQIVAANPDLPEAQARLGRALLETDAAELLRWQHSLPQKLPDVSHPELWYVVGLAAQRDNDLPVAARCFMEAVRLHPDHREANYCLSQVLRSLGNNAAGEFVQRTQQLDELRIIVDRLKIPGDRPALREVVKLLVALGRDLEAMGWCSFAVEIGEPWAKESLAELQANAGSPQTFVRAEAKPVRLIDISAWPLPAAAVAQGIAPKQALANRSPENSAEKRSYVRFVDEASLVGLDFTYFNGALPDPFESMYQFDGGGIAVLDFDGDGWPDLYFTQGGPVPPHPRDPRYTGRLFRNLSGQRFVDITDSADVRDLGYGQGVAVGDFDGDGFPDFVIAKIGANRFFRNNGDGTFHDWTARVGLSGDAWTSSCVFADLNNDSFPELYDVNYLHNDGLTARFSRKDDAVRYAPVQLPAAPDQLWLNSGDGQFVDVTKQAGIVDRDGRGLGVVAADFDGSRRVSLYVANDMSANYFFANQTSAPGEMPMFKEDGLLRGVAFNDQGAAQASMGIAAGDATGDGQLDLFVTNFYREANNFFVQQPNVNFVDEARRAALFHPGFFQLGWGTQFVDADLDGRLDLFVANGHVHEPSDPKIPYRMLPQFFYQTEGQKFREVPPAEAGSFFSQPQLGRAMARLDWNRDGREDVCIGHLDTPTALLTNRSTKTGNFIALRLIGTTSSRDATGASVRCCIGSQTIVRQLTAGDGYQASNEKLLLFGLGKADMVTECTIAWPSGMNQSFRDLPANRHWLVIENQFEPIAITMQ